MSADARVMVHLLTLKCGPPLGKEPSREEIKLADRMISILKDFEARQLEVDEGEQLEAVEEEEDWDPQDEPMDVERKASSGHVITFSAGGTLVSEERVRLQLDFGCVLITMEEDKVAEKSNKESSMCHKKGQHPEGRVAAVPNPVPSSLEKLVAYA